MISEDEMLKALVLGHLPKDVVGRFLQDHPDTLRGGFDSFKCFLSFVQFFESSNHKVSFTEDAFDHILSGRSIDFFVGFIRHCMTGKREDLKNLMFRSKYFEKWIRQNHHKLEEARKANEDFLVNLKAEQ